MENKSQIIIYQTEAGGIKLEVRLENETVWLSHDKGKTFLVISEALKELGYSL